MDKIRKYFLIFLLLFPLACEQNKQEIMQKGDFSKGLKVGKWEYHDDGNIYEINWSNYENDTLNIRFNYPTNWEAVNDDDCIFKAKLEKKQKHIFFVFLRHDKIQHNVNINIYFKALYEALKNDTKEHTVSYNLQERTLRDKRKVYQGKITSIIDNKKYLSYVFYMDYGGFVYDIVYKTTDDNKTNSINKIIFDDIIYSILIKDEKLILLDDVQDPILIHLNDSTGISYPSNN
jgi:hypothetical protein